jgi:hypothetical protein
MDSLRFLQKELQGLLEAYHRTFRDDIILRDYPIEILGDSVLGDYSYLILPFGISQPFIPWKVKLSLAENDMKADIDNRSHRVTSVEAPLMKCSFTRNPNGILVMHERNTVQKNGWGQFYITPVDSVFYNRVNKIIRIKRYIHVFTVINGNQRGVPLFLHLAQVRQYTYGPDQQMTQYQVVKFCERWKAYDVSKVCSIITCAISSENDTVWLTRRNDPVNNFSDGTFTYVFDDHDNLKSISFHNLAKTEDWQRTIELNREGNVHCYFDRVKGVLLQSLCMIYHPEAPGTQYKVEIIMTTFETNGISYYQKNNTTGAIRTRDRMTLEWGPWK